eukprot:1146692-Pyramimonas_sp.AAC.1
MRSREGARPKRLYVLQERQKSRSGSSWGDKLWVTGNKKDGAQRRSEEYPQQFCEAVATVVISDLA